MFHFYMNRLRSLCVWCRIPAKRNTKSRSVWGFETERLEDRALLSAAARQRATLDASTAADVASEPRAAAFQPPNVAGTWLLTIPGVTGDPATVVMTQVGAKVTVKFTNTESQQVTTIVDSFTKHSPFTLSHKTPKIDFPTLPKPLKLLFTLNFEQGNLAPETLTGSLKVKRPPVNQALTGTRQHN